MSKADLSRTVAGLGTILGVWAHPDDESFMSGGLIATATGNGQAVICITATKGERGIQDESKWPADKLAQIRDKELEAALKILGVSQHIWLGYSDGACSKVNDDEAIGKIVEVIKMCKPDTIITFPPDGGTGHFDHICVSKWALKAAERTGVKIYYAADLEEQYQEYFKDLDEKFNIYFNLEKPGRVPKAECDILLELSPEAADTKCQALEAMPSQTSRMFKSVGRKRLCEAQSVEGYVRADKHREWGKPKSA